jgi:DNA modification methylase
MKVNILSGDVRDILPTLPNDHFDCVVTSPPYWGLRDYGVEGQIGLEPTMQGYLDTMVSVCRELRRVLKPEGTFWLNIGDSYANTGGKSQPHRNNSGGFGGSDGCRTQGYAMAGGNFVRPNTINGNIKPKDLCMIPNRLAILLQDDGWYVRSEIIWHKPNPMPESVRDRPTSAHEKVWLLTKSQKYFYDADAIKEKSTGQTGAAADFKRNTKDHVITNQTVAQHRFDRKSTEDSGMKNVRNVWSISPKPFKGAHFATMPPDLAERCIKAGCPKDGMVLDPFGGSGTTGMVAARLQRKYTLIELNADYIALANARIDNEAPLLGLV